MARRPKNEYKNWIRLLSETSAIRELLGAEVESLLHECNKDMLKERIIESPQIGDRITEKIFESFIDLIGVKILESPNKEFYIPKLGTFVVKTHKGHKIKMKSQKQKDLVVDVADYKMLRFHPDPKFKSYILMTDSPTADADAVNNDTENNKGSSSSKKD